MEITRCVAQFFLDSIQCVARVTSENKNSVKLHFISNKLEISASIAEYGQSYENIAIAYNAFLCDPLKAFVQDEVFFEFKDELTWVCSKKDR